MKFNCKICNKEFKRYGKQALVATTCSYECLGVYNKAKNNTICTQCGCEFHIKESQKKRYKRNHGYFCSTTCVANFRKGKFLGEENPNFRIQVDRDTDGYKLAYIPKFGRIKLHHKVVFEYLNIDKIPKNMGVHHRDCNVDNNSEENLVILSHSDHKWLHKQFGNATLWAYVNKKISLEELLQWSNDRERAKILLPLSILDQKESGVFKQGELLESPTTEIVNEDNQQPSLASNSFEGSTTNSQVLASNVEDSNANTSALPFNINSNGFVTSMYNDITVKWKPIKGFDY